MSDPQTSLVDLRGVAIPSRNDPATMLVSGIDWSIQAGEFWVVAGLPGCGKSQLLEIIAGLVPPHAGTTRVYAEDGTAITETSPRAPWQRIGLIFADGGRPFNQLTVAQNIGLPLCYHRGCSLASVAPQVQHLLDRTGLAAYGKRLPSRLNRGLRQRLALARALALEPALLLLDNPLSGLGASQVRWWLDFLAHPRHAAVSGSANPVAVAVTTDDLRPWLTIGTDFALIEDARWRRLGGRADVVASTDPSVRDLLADPV